MDSSGSGSGVVSTAEEILHLTHKTMTPSLSHLSQQSSPTKQFHQKLVEDQHKDISMSSTDYSQKVYPVINPMYTPNYNTTNSNSITNTITTPNSCLKHDNFESSNNNNDNDDGLKSTSNSSNYKGLNGLGTTFSNFTFFNSNNNKSNNSIPESDQPDIEKDNEFRLEPENTGEGKKDVQEGKMDENLFLSLSAKNSRANTPSEFNQKNRRIGFKRSPYNSTAATNRNMNNNFTSEIIFTSSSTQLGSNY